MQTNKKGFTVLLIAIIVAVLVISGGASFYLQKNNISNNKTPAITDNCTDQKGDKIFNSKEFFYDAGTIYKKDKNGAKNVFVKIIDSQQLGKKFAEVSFPLKGSSALVMEYLSLGMENNVLNDIYLLNLESGSTTTVPSFTDGLGRQVEYEYYLSPNSKCVANMSSEGQARIADGKYNQYTRVLSIYNTDTKQWSKIMEWSATNYFDDKYFSSWSSNSGMIYLHDHIIHGPLSVNDTNPTIYHNDLLFKNDIVYSLDVNKKTFFEYVTPKDICSTAREVEIYPNDNSWVLSNCFSEKSGVKYTTYQLSNLKTKSSTTLGTFPMFGSNQRGFIHMWPEAEKIISAN